MTLALGLMSGTSCDGVSAALAQFTESRGVRVLAHRTDPYPKPLGELLRRSRELTTPDLAQLNVLLGELFALSALRLLRDARVSPRGVAVIGSHGHTVYHGPADPIPCTLQLGEPSVIAQRTGIAVVADFRPRDLAAGGEGAPLIPFFDVWAFGDGPPRALQNIGGIANVTLTGRGLTPLAFDTGPGNCLLDLLTRRATRGRESFDRDGRIAATGRVDHALVAKLWRHPYFRRKPPKSTGPELFNERFLDDTIGPRWRRRPGELLATLTYFTAFSIAESLRRFARVPVREMIVSGGGVRNRALMRHLALLMRPVPVVPIDRYGIPAHAKEPAAFALLGLRALRRQSNHLPSTTGATRACILGKVVPA